MYAKLFERRGRVQSAYDGGGGGGGGGGVQSAYDGGGGGGGVQSAYDGGVQSASRILY